MNKVVMAAMVAVVVGVGLDAEPSLGGSALLEIDVNDNGDVLEVRDGGGKPLDEAAFTSIGGFDLIVSRDLLFGEVLGNPVRCCPRGGRWYACAEIGFTGKSSTLFIDDAAEITRVDGRVGGVWKEDLPEGGSGPIPSAVIRSLKSHVVAVVESQGTRYGMVITSGDSDGGAQKIWYDAKVFEISHE